MVPEDPNNGDRGGGGGSAAQAYFNSFPLAEQRRIRESWAGQNRMDEWFQNALSAGDPGAIAATGQSQQSETDFTTGSTPQGSQFTGQGPGGETFPQMVRRTAREGGWSEDFARMSDAQISAWQKYWDPQAKKFRSEHDQFAGQGAVFEKPTDLPAGYSFHGNSVVKTTDLPWWAEGSAQAPPETGATAAGGGLADNLLYSYGEQAPVSDLQRGLEEKFINREGGFQFETAPVAAAQTLGGGGLWWGTGANEAGARNLFEGALPTAAPAPAASRPVSSTASPRRPMPETPAPGTIPVPATSSMPATLAPQLAQSLYRRANRPVRWWDTGERAGM